jgi:hypothetical protein
MKKLFLTKEKYALVDDSDFELLSKYKWSCNGADYARRTIHSGGEPGKIHSTRKTKKIFLHHEILGRPPKGMVTDHINRNPLDNRRVNLRFCTHSQNHANEEKHKNNTSGYRGVTFHQGKWRARIKHLGKWYHLGYFVNKKDAAISYNIGNKKFFGSFALLNKL